MPWWSWILLWVALAALTALFLVLLGLRLYRGFMATLRELQAASHKFSLHGRPGAETVAAGTAAADPAAASALPEPGIFLDPGEARKRYEAGKEARRLMRRERRVIRRAERGQPQSLWDLPHL